MSQEFQHYQTSFCVSAESVSEGDLYKKLQHMAFQWIAGKENDRCRQSHRKNFGMHLPSSFYSKGNAKSRASQFFSESCYSDSGHAWVVEYSHIDGTVRGLSWTTHIGLRQFPGQGKVAVSVLLNYRVSTELALAQNVKLPTPSVPGFVRRVFKEFSKLRILCGGFSIEARKAFQYVETEAEAKSIANYIEDPSRLLSVVLVVGKSSDAEEEAKRLGWALQGKALVFIVPYDPRLRRPFKPYRVEFRQCRILLPFGKFGSALGTHICYSIDNPEKAAEVRERAVRSQLGYYTIVEPGSVTTLADIRSLIRNETFLKVKKDLEGKASELADNEKWKEFSDSVMQQYEAETKKTEELSAQLETKELQILELQSEKEDLEKAKNAEIFNLKASYESKGRKNLAPDFKPPVEFPDSMEGLRKWAESGAFPHLRFSSSAWKPAMNYETFTDFGGLWKILWHLDNTLYKLKYLDKVASIEQEFEKTGIRYSRTEGSNTTHDSKLAALRRFEFEGASFEMWTHVGLGNREPHMIRVYFAFDDTVRRIVVGYVGPHMDNATTKTIH